MSTARMRHAHAFTVVELVVIVVVLAIVTGVAIPRYHEYSAQTRRMAVQNTLDTVRAAIANFYATRALAGAPEYPTLTELTSYGHANSVLTETLPPNPLKPGPESNAVVAATWAPTPPVDGPQGWAYDPATGKFWSNSTTDGSHHW